MSKNFFKLLNLPEKLLIDHNELKKNYFNLIKECSRDPILDKDSGKKSNTRRRGELDEAFNTLKDRLLRIEHLLTIEGVGGANDNKTPSQFETIATSVANLTKKAMNDPKSREELKKIHSDVMSEFSSVSIELAKLENAWDATEESDPEILKKLKRKSAAFNFIRNVDKEIRAILNA